MCAQASQLTTMPFKFLKKISKMLRQNLRYWRFWKWLDRELFEFIYLAIFGKYSSFMWLKKRNKIQVLSGYLSLRSFAPKELRPIRQANKRQNIQQIKLDILWVQWLWVLDSFFQNLSDLSLPRIQIISQFCCFITKYTYTCFKKKISFWSNLQLSIGF